MSAAAAISSTIEELEKKLTEQQKELWELECSARAAKRAKVDPDEQKIADASASVAALKKQIRKAKKEEFRAVLKARPAVLHPTSRVLGPPSDVMIDYPKKADWFASLPAETRFEVANYGLMVTRAAMIYECDRANDAVATTGDCGGGFYDMNTDLFEHDILLAANLVDDGAVWVGSKVVEVPEPVEE